MSRPKGSKNKPKTSQSPPITPPDFSTPENLKPKRKRRTKAEMEAYRASLKAQEEAQEYIDTSLVDETILADVEKEEQEKKEWEEQVTKQAEKDKIYEEDLKQPEKATTEVVKKIIGKNKKQLQYPLCDCCEKEIYCSPHRIDTNVLSAQVADYHRESPRWVNLCSECAHELSDVVDRWLAGNGCLTKLEQRMRDRQKEKEEEKNG